MATSMKSAEEYATLWTFDEFLTAFISDYVMSRIDMTKAANESEIVNLIIAEVRAWNRRWNEVLELAPRYHGKKDAFKEIVKKRYLKPPCPETFKRALAYL